MEVWMISTFDTLKFLHPVNSLVKNITHLDILLVLLQHRLLQCYPSYFCQQFPQIQSKTNAFSNIFNDFKCIFFASSRSLGYHPYLPCMAESRIWVPVPCTNCSLHHHSSSRFSSYLWNLGLHKRLTLQFHFQTYGSKI